MELSGERIALAGVLCLVAGVGYAMLVHWMETRWPGHPYTAEQVVLGTIVTLLIAFLVVPAEYVLRLFVLFGLVGGWQIAGAWYRNRQRQAEVADRLDRFVPR